MDEGPGQMQPPATPAEAAPAADDAARDAEERPSPPEDARTAEVEALVHDLRVQQVELEMQNEELAAAQVELEESRALYEELFDEAPVGYVTLDRDDVIVESNQTAARLLDMNPHALNGRRFYELVKPEDRDQLYLLQRRLAKAQVPQRCELRLQRGRGAHAARHGTRQYFWAEVLARPPHAHAVSLHLRLTFTDVSARRQAEQERDDAAAQFAAIFRQSPLPMSLIETEGGTWLDVNPAWEALTGVPHDEAVGRTSVEVGLVTDVEQRKDAVDRLRGGENVESLFRTHVRGGGVRQCAGTSVVLSQPGAPVALTILRDLTEELEAQQLLKMSNERLQATFDSMLDPLVRLEAVHDENGDIVDFVFADANEAACAFNRLTRDDLMGTMLLRQHPAAGTTELLEMYRHVVETGEPLVLDDWSYPQDMLGGELRRYDVRAVRVGDGFVQTWRDVTERLSAAERVRRLNEQLEARVQLRTAELAAANDELEAFAYSISHDLRAPLRAIDGFSEMVLEDAGDRLSPDDVDHLTRARRAAQRMASLIDAMLALSRATRTALALADVDLSALAAGVIEDMRAQDAERAVDAVVAPGLHVVGDAALLRTVLVNLLGNAWKFTSKHQAARIELGVTEAGGERAFFVRDDGAGFDPAYADKLWGAFQRVHSPDDFEGEGIGLATVQRLIRRHGGRVWAEGEVERGATFFFTVPPPAGATREASAEDSAADG